MNPLRPTLGCCGVRPKAPKGGPLLTAGAPGSGGANFDAELALYEAQDAQLEPLWSGGGLLEHRRRLRQASAEKPSANTPAPLDEDDEDGSRDAPNGHGSSLAKPGAGQSGSAAARGALGSGSGQQASSFFAPSAAAAGKEHVAVIQGASGGIGLELVTQLLERRDLRARSGTSVLQFRFVCQRTADPLLLWTPPCRWPCCCHVSSPGGVPGSPSAARAVP